MVKKLQKIADKQGQGGGASMAQLLDGQLASAVRDSAQQIWQAGLGAFAKAQGEGGKVFDALVKEGVSLQRKTQGAAEDKLGEMSSKMTRLSTEVQSKAGQQWDRLEAIFEERVAKAMGKLGVPSRQEVAALSKRVDALSASLSRTAKARPAAKAAASRKTAAKTAPVERAAAKRTTASKRAA
jgi:poly(hydroxyalkanoate) granule-associated protein